MEVKIRNVSKKAAQGDLLILRVDEVPDGLPKRQAEGGRHIVAHSETGHHHTVDDLGTELFGEQDPDVCYLRVEGEHTDLVHHRSYDTHDTLRLGRGIWMLKRQRESTPEGWRRVED